MDIENLYIAGTQHTAGTHHDWRIEKRDKNTGALVESFADFGILSLNADKNELEYYLYDIAYDNGYIFVSGEIGDKWELQKRAADTGALVTTFGDGGRVIQTFYHNQKFVGGISQMEAVGNYIYLAHNENILEKRDIVTGALDLTFGNNGYLTNLAHIQGAPCFCIQNSNIYIGNHILDDLTNTWEVRIESYQAADAQPNLNFGANGLFSVNYHISSLICSASHIYLVQHQADPLDHMDIKSLTAKIEIASGIADITFGVNGTITINPSGGYEHMTTGLIADSSLFLGGYQFSGDTNIWRIDKIDTLTGNHLADFGLNGFVNSSSLNTVMGRPESMIYENGVLFVAGYMTDTQVDYWRIEKRDALAGSLVSGFGQSGVVFVAR